MPETTSDGVSERYTADELRAKLAREGSRTDWARVDALTEAELEAAIAADPDWADVPRDWWKRAKPVDPRPGARRVDLVLAPDIVAWLEAKDGALESEAVIALRAAMRAEQDDSSARD